MDFLMRHLDRQRRDRQVYWSWRAESRVCALNGSSYKICGILDSMDQQKHGWPKAPELYAKEFASFNKPRLAHTALVIHGYSVNIALSPHNHTSNSSRTTVILATALTSLAKETDLSRVEFSLQADNASKEVENNGQLRFLSYLVALRRLRKANMCFLSSGHSHEDVDAFFNTVRTWWNRHRTLPTPAHFRQSLVEFFADSTNRPREKRREVQYMTKFRDWCCTFALTEVEQSVWGRRTGRHKKASPNPYRKLKTYSMR